MNSSPKPTPAVSHTQLPGAPFAASAGMPFASGRTDSPIDAWMDLMEAIEALCPRWPEPSPRVGCDYRL